MSVEPVPEGFLRNLLDAYGLQWTHLTILGGVAFSSLGLQRYLNAGVWILGTVAAFALVLLFRDQIQWSFPRTACVTFPAMVVVVAVPTIVVLQAKEPLGHWIAHRSVLSTSYLALALGVPLAVTILAYRRQEHVKYLELPPTLQSAMDREIRFAPFIHEDVRYMVEIADWHGDEKSEFVSFRWQVVMKVLNRSKDARTYRDLFSRYRPDDRLPHAALNGTPLDTEEPDKVTGRGFIVLHRADPGERFTVEVHGESRLNRRDNELIGSYLPANHFAVQVRPAVNGLRVNVHSHVPFPQDVRRLANGDLLYDYPEGLLPYQGVRVVWGPRPGDVS